MPARPKTSRAEIVSAALDLINEGGADGLSMLAVAQKVGVRGPSLYKHFPDRATLLKAVESHLFEKLGAALADAAPGCGDRENAKQMASAYRNFAKQNPRGYALMFASGLPDAEAATIRRAAAQPALDLLYGLLGDADAALSAARAFTAFCHGFVSMELAGAFRLGGDIEQAFAEGVEVVLAGIIVRAKKEAWTPVKALDGTERNAIR
ncbi:MAG: TetR/AcrR family transcriptional regulator [Rhodomicrobium sp.]